MKIKIMLRGALQNFDDPDSLDQILEFEVPQGCTCEDALGCVGLTTSNPNFGFVAINEKRVPIEQELQEGDFLKIFSALYGG